MQWYAQRTEFCLQTNQVRIKYSHLVEKAMLERFFNACYGFVWFTENPHCQDTLQTFCAGPFLPHVPALTTSAMFSRACQTSHNFPHFPHLSCISRFHAFVKRFLRLQICHTFQKVPITSWWQNRREIRRKFGILQEKNKEVLNLL